MTGEQLVAILNDNLSSKIIDANYYFNGKRPVDLLQTPLDTVNDLKSIPSSYRYIGMTVKVLSGDTLDSKGKNIPDEYWLVGGTKNANWVKKPSVLDGKLSLNANVSGSSVELMYDGNVIGTAADLTDILTAWQSDKYISNGAIVTDNGTKYLLLFYNDQSLQPGRVDLRGISGGGSASGGTGGDENVIEHILVNGQELSVIAKTVNIDLSGYATTGFVGSAITEALGDYATSADTVEAISRVARPSLSADTYSDAKLLATADNIGQIIDVKDEDFISGETYSEGLYVVTGEGEIAKLGLASATGDISGDVENLKGRVGTLESNVSRIIDYLYWETDEELEIE